VWGLAGVAHADNIKWHVDISATETIESNTSKDVHQGNANSSHHETHHHQVTLRLSSDDLGSPEMPLGGGKVMFRLDVPKPSAKSLSGSYVDTTAAKTSGDYGGVYQSNSEDNSSTNGKLDTVGYQFAYEGDDNWSFSVDSGGTATVTTHACSNEVKPHPDHQCNDTNDKSPVSFGFTGDANSGAKLVRTPTGFAIDYSHDEPDDNADEGRKGTHHIEWHVTLSRAAAKPALVIEPADPEAYQAWIPTPVDEPSIFGKAAPVAVRVHMRDKSAPAKPITFELRDVSELPGTATNYPIDAKDGKAPSDLRFASHQPPGIVVEDERHAHTTSPVTTAIVNIEATDAGAWGVVQASIPSDGTIARNATTGGDGVELPYAPDHDHIAYQWKNKFHVIGKDATSDEDDRMDQRDAGDGYTLFEEYRGFVALENHGDHTYQVGIRKHVRTDPTKKDVFCHDKDAVVLHYYFPENPAQLEWHFVDEKTVRLLADMADPTTRLVNTNTPKQLRYGDQFAIEAFISHDTSATNKFAGNSSGMAVLRDDLTPPGDDNPNGKLSHPRLNDFKNPIHSYKYLVLWPDNIYAMWSPLLTMAGAGPGWHDTKDGHNNDLLKQAIQAELKQTAIHEIGHYLGVHHHWVEGRSFQSYDAKTHTISGPNPQDDDSEFYGADACAMRYNNPTESADLQKGVIHRPRTTYCRAGDHAVDAHGKPKHSDNCWGQITVKTVP
jgi:hypothetical protein